MAWLLWDITDIYTESFRLFSITVENAFISGGGTYRQFRAEQGDEDFPPPPPQSSYIEEVAYPPPQVEQSRAYGYNDPHEDFPPPPSPTANYNTHSPENVQYGVHSQMYSSYDDSPHNRYIIWCEIFILLASGQVGLEGRY